MNKFERAVKCLAWASLAGAVSGCTTQNPNLPLVFGQSHTVGLSISASAPEQGVDLSLGYKDKDIAIVPVTAAQSGGNNSQIKSKATSDYEDALSVIGQFELNAEGRQADVGLGKFFATGMAAKTLADGFKAKLSK